MRAANRTMLAGLLVATAAIFAPVTRGQSVQFTKAVPTGAPTAPLNVLKDVGVDQKLGDKIPGDLTFKDENGKTVKLSDYFNNGHRPILLTPVYYECPMLCTMTLNGVTKAMRATKLNVGVDYDVITFSFDPRETPDLAAAKKKTYLKFYNRDESTAEGWHFLTGDEDQIKKLTQAIGFRYTWDKSTQQFAHASAIMILTPDGTLSRYFYGLDYSARDMQLGLVEASDNKIGTLSDELLLLCFHYDPESGKYGPSVMKMIRGGGVITLLGIGTFIGLMLRRDRRLATTADGQAEESDTATSSS